MYLRVSTDEEKVKQGRGKREERGERKREEGGER